MSYLNCRHGDPCEACNGYIGPLDTYACLCCCHTREPQPAACEPQPADAAPTGKDAS